MSMHTSSRSDYLGLYLSGGDLPTHPARLLSAVDCPAHGRACSGDQRSGPRRAWMTAVRVV